MSHPGYLAYCHVNIHAGCVLLKVTFFQISSGRGERGKETRVPSSCIHVDD